MNAPCLGCVHRFVGCHATCTQYKKYVEERKAIRKKQFDEKELNVHAIENVGRVQRENRRIGHWR